MTRTARVLLALCVLVATTHPAPSAAASAAVEPYLTAAGADAPLLAVTDAPWRIPAARASFVLPQAALAGRVRVVTVAAGPGHAPQTTAASPRRRQRARRCIRDDGPPH